MKPSRIRTIDRGRNPTVRLGSVAAWTVPAVPVVAVTGVEVTVIELRSEGAALNCALFSTPQGFPDPRSSSVKITAAVSDGRAVRRFSGVPETNVFGVPAEGVACSRDGRGRLGPPSFEAARFVHRPEAKRLQLCAVY